MSRFATLRVLVTLATAFALLSIESDARPIPSSFFSPRYLVQRSPQVALLSSSPTPPLPVMLMARDHRKRDASVGSFTKQRQFGSKQSDSSKADEASKRDEHIHEHIHSDGDGYDHGYPHGDWTKEEMDHHSDHWAWHHGLLHDEHYPEDVHIHEHIHEHKRDDATAISERGLLGALLDPVLASLHLPGLVTISQLLFGDGVKDGGLLKTLGGLVLKVEPSHAHEAQDLYSLSLMTDKNQRTQVFLAPVNESSSDGSPSMPGTNDSMAVKITLPFVNSTGSAVLMCAAFAVAPPSVLTLESCGRDNESKAKGTSQFFTYTPSTGELSPMAMYSDLDNNTSTSQDMPDGQGGNNGTTKSKLLMHFVPISNLDNSTTISTDAVNDDSTPFATAMTNDSTLPAPEQTMAHRTMARLPIYSQGKRQDSNEDDGVSAPSSDGSFDEEPESSAEGSEAGLADDLNGTASQEPTPVDATNDDDEQPTQIFLAVMNVKNEDQMRKNENASVMPDHVSQWDGPPYNAPSNESSSSPCKANM